MGIRISIQLTPAARAALDYLYQHKQAKEESFSLTEAVCHMLYEEAQKVGYRSKERPIPEVRQRRRDPVDRDERLRYASSIQINQEAYEAYRHIKNSYMPFSLNGEINRLVIRAAQESGWKIPHDLLHRPSPDEGASA